MNYYMGQNGSIESGKWSGLKSDLKYWTYDGASEWFKADEQAIEKAVIAKPIKRRNDPNDDKVSQNKGSENEFSLVNN